MDTLMIFGLAPVMTALVLLLTLPTQRRLATAMSWVAQAQAYYAARLYSQLSILLAPFTACVLAYSYAQPLWVYWAAGLLSFVVSFTLRWLLLRRIQRQALSWGAYLQSVALFGLLMGSFSFLISGLLATLMPWSFTSQVAVITGLWLILMLSLRGSVTLGMLQRLGWLKPASARLERCMEAAAESSGIQPKLVFEAPSFVANALALPTEQGVIFTTATLDTLDDEQVEAVAAHELCHLGMSKLQVTLRMGAVVMLNAAFLLCKPIIGQFGVSTYLLLGVLLYVLLVAVLGRLARKEEERADAAAVDHTESEEVYARALEQIHRVNLIPADLKSSAGHPALYDRMLSSGVTPDFERPGKPPLLRFRIALFLHLFLIIYLILNS